MLIDLKIDDDLDKDLIKSILTECFNGTDRSFYMSYISDQGNYISFWKDDELKLMKEISKLYLEKKLEELGEHGIYGHLEVLIREIEEGV